MKKPSAKISLYLIKIQNMKSGVICENVLLVTHTDWLTGEPLDATQ